MERTDLEGGKSCLTCNLIGIDNCCGGVWTALEYVLVSEIVTLNLRFKLHQLEDS